MLVLRLGDAGLECLMLRRAAGGRSPGSWEGVHGKVDEGEDPVATALRELGEETGLVPERLYNLSRVEMFYRHRSDEVSLVPVFAAMVSAEADVMLSEEHDAAMWLPLEAARRRASWPRMARALEDAGRLLAGGDAGAMDDELRLR
ncbi:MAG TPA: NUDIX domain-containing protein [Gemmatimonadales bacterium]|nr:NUDIX domain-containing protein [Gemmatimonadales bacterium]